MTKVKKWRRKEKNVLRDFPLKATKLPLTASKLPLTLNQIAITVDGKLGAVMAILMLIMAI